MIQAVLIFNSDGKPRLSKYYNTSDSFINTNDNSHLKLQLLKTIHSLTTHHQNQINHSNNTNLINLNHSLLESINPNLNLNLFQLHPEFLRRNLCLVYRNYATLFFVFIIDHTESQLAILDLIQVFVESLDKCFKNVCELDLIFNYDKLDLLLNQIILGGIVLDTNVDSIVENFQLQLKSLKNSSYNLNSSNPASLVLHSAFPSISS